MYSRHVGASGGTKTKAGAEYDAVLDKLTECLGIDQVLAQTLSEGFDVAALSDSTQCVADFSVSVARYPMAERLFLATLSMDEQVYGTTSAQVARDCLSLATLYIRFRVAPSDGAVAFTKGEF
jgi:hypothetical protein